MSTNGLKRLPRSGRSRLLAAALAAALGGSLPARADQPPSQEVPPPAAEPAPPPTPPATPWYKEISVNGFLSLFYEYNTNRPASGRNQYRIFDYVANSVSVDAAEIVVQKPAAGPGEVGFRVDVVAGAVARVASAAGLFQGEDVDLQQAFVSYVAPLGSGLRFDFGKFVTHMGYEVIEGYDGWNDNATRSFLFGWAIPFTNTGLKASYAFSDTLSGMLVVTNGWDNVTDNNTGKSVGAQIAWSPAKALALTGNYIGGPEQNDTNANWRNVGNLVAQWKATGAVVFTLELTYGGESGAITAGETATWSGLAGYVRYSPTDHVALTLRAEYFADPDGARTGVKQYLKEVTLTPEWRISSHFLVRGDVRVDWSSREVFETSSGFTTTQPTILFDAIYVF
jgi:hypothetical protein